MNRAISVLMIFAFLLFSFTPSVWGEDQGRKDELIERMIRIVFENNPSLKSQGGLVREIQGIREPRSKLSISGINFNAGAGFWNTDTDSFGFIPTVTMGLSLSPSDPSRALNILRFKKEKEGAKQDYQEIKNSIIADLFANVREILRLESQRESLEKLKEYLEDYSDLTERQVKAGVMEPEPEKLWDLKERIMGIEVEVQEANNQLNTIRLEAAIRLGGEAWEELLDLFWQLDGQI